MNSPDKNPQCFHSIRPAEAEPQSRIQGKEQEGSEGVREGLVKRASIGCVNEPVGLRSAGPQGNCRADLGVGPLRSPGIYPPASVCLWSRAAGVGIPAFPTQGNGLCHWRQS